MGIDEDERKGRFNESYERHSFPPRLPFGTRLPATDWIRDRRLARTKRDARIRRRPVRADRFLCYPKSVERRTMPDAPQGLRDM